MGFRGLLIRAVGGCLFVWFGQNRLWEPGRAVWWFGVLGLKVLGSGFRLYGVKFRV